MRTKCLLYCTKEADLVYFAYGDETYQAFKTGEDWVNSLYNPNDIALYNGKASIVAECEVECEEIYYNLYYSPRTHYSFKYETINISMDELLAKSCLTMDELDNYFTQDEVKHKCGYAIHIDNLNVLDKPLKLNELLTYNTKNVFKVTRVEKAPQNMMWVWYKGERYCLISIRPQWLCKILNGEKTIEVRKKVLKEMIK